MLVFTKGKSMRKLIAVVRHGDYVGNGDDTCPLSELGWNQIVKVRELIEQHCRSVYSSNREDVTRLTFSFSTAVRALQSATLLRSFRDGDIVITDLFITEREDIESPQKIVEMILSRLNHWGLSVAVIVAHGDMPAVLAETVRNLAKNEEGKSLPYPEKGEGFIVDVESGEVHRITPLAFQKIN